MGTVQRIASRHLRASNTFAGIDVRSWAERRESWWTDMSLLIKEWWNFHQVTTRRVRGKLTAYVDFRGQGTQRNIEITIKGNPSKPTVYVWAAEKKFGPTNSLKDIIYWIDSVVQNDSSAHR